MATQTNITIAEKFAKPLAGLRNLYELLEEHIPRHSVSLKAPLVPLINLFGEESFISSLAHVDELTSPKREEIIALLQQISNHIKAISRLLYSIGTNNTKQVAFALTDVTEQLEKKIRSFEEVRKRLISSVHMNSVSTAAASNIRDDNGRILWEMCFGNRTQIPLSDFHREINSIIENALQCPVDDLKLFFNGDSLTLESYRRFLNIVSANSVTTNQSGLVGPAKSLSDFIRLQLRLGHLREPLLRTKRPSVDSQTPPTPLPTQSGPKTDVELVEHHLDWTWIKPQLLKWFKEVDEVYRFFYGSISSQEALRLLDGKEPGTFLLRFSSDNPDRLCVSSVHSVPKKDRGGWKEMVMRINVVVHHELVMTRTYEHVVHADVNGRFQGLLHRSAVTRKQAYNELKQILEHCEEVDRDLSWLYDGFYGDKTHGPGLLQTA